MPACEIWVLESKYKCLFFQKNIFVRFDEKISPKWTNLKNCWMSTTLLSLRDHAFVRFCLSLRILVLFPCWNSYIPFWENKHLQRHSKTQISHAGIIFDADSELKVRFPMLWLFTFSRNRVWIQPWEIPFSPSRFFLHLDRTIWESTKISTTALFRENTVFSTYFMRKYRILHTFRFSMIRIRKLYSQP